MPSITFAHRYKKLDALGGVFDARLLQVVPVLYKDLTMAFLNYDTDNGKHKLEKEGWYLLLIFQGNAGIFTTLRSHTTKKAKFYASEVGQMFTIEIPD